MRVINFSEMFSSDYNIKRLFAMNQKWADGNTYSCMGRPRQTSAFIYFKNCDAIYTLASNETIHVNKGTLLYLPQGAQYSTRFCKCGETAPHSQLIEFEMTDENDEIFIGAPTITALQLSKTIDLAAAFDEITTLYSKPTRSYGLLKSKSYAFLNEICNSYLKNRICSMKYAPIAKGIEYLEHTSSYELSVAEIANMCHVSETYFRSLFEQYAGVSPHKYKTNRLIRQAREMIQSGELTIKEISDHLGFNDVGYFSRWFKKNVGVTPSHFSKEFFD